MPPCVRRKQTTSSPKVGCSSQAQGPRFFIVISLNVQHIEEAKSGNNNFCNSAERIIMLANIQGSDRTHFF